MSPGLVVGEEYVFKSDTAKIRTHMTCKAALLLLFTTSSTLQGEETTTAINLRRHLIEILVNAAATTPSENPASIHEQPSVLPSVSPESSTTIPEPSYPLLPSTPVSAVTSTSSASDQNLATQSTIPALSVEETDPSLVTPPNNQGQRELMSKRICTQDLLTRQENIRQTQDKGRKYTSREVVRRLNLQKDELTKLAKNVHYGSKNDFISSLAETVTNGKGDNHDNDDWDGSLTPQDVVNLAKIAHDHQKRKPIYDIIIQQDAAKHYHLSAMEVLNLQDTTNPTEMLRELRRKLPGYFDSESKVNILKAKLRREFEVVWQPKRTHSGWQISPERLRETLLHLYWWMPPNEWWKIYGDGRNFGGKDSVAITLNVLNSEAMFHGISYHSPEEYWPLYIFYGKDTRLNLELNLGDPTKQDSLNAWTESMISRGHKVFVSCDSKFSDNLLGGGLDSTSTDSFTMYNYETKDTRCKVGENTGFRSELGRKIDREHPESLLPSLPTSCYIPDGNHCFCRLTEHMVFDRCMTCLNLEGQQTMGGQAARDQTLNHFLSNINARGVRNGRFELKYEGKRLEQITLNVNHAETISSPASEYARSPYPEILENVASKEVLFDLPDHLKSELKWPSLKISEYDLEMKLWEVNWELHKMERWDEDPRQFPNRLNPGASVGSKDPSDYRFGLTDIEIDKYVKLADLYHALTLLRYGSSKLYPYLMKRVDVFSIMLRDLPFHSLFRGGTEGGERTHYMHQCLYFGHSARGGGWKKQDPIITLFTWYYRFLRRRIEKCPTAVKEAYEAYVKKKFEEAGLDYSTEMKEVESPSVQASSSSGQELTSTSQSSCDQLAQVTDDTNHSSSSDMQSVPQQHLPQSAAVAQSQPSRNILTVEDSLLQYQEADNYKRGDRVFIEKDGQTTKAMVCEVTPQKKRVKVAVNPKEPPFLVEIASLCEPDPQVLNGLTFVVSGRLNEKDKSGITNAEQLTPVIVRNGGKVFTKDVSQAADADFILITSQKELEKDVKKINKPIVHAYRYKWPIVSKQFVLEADKRKVLPDIENYKLQVNNLDNAPTNALLHARIVRQSELMVRCTNSAHRELKKIMRKKRKPESRENDVSGKENDVPKQKPKRPANGFIVFTTKTYGQLAKDNPEKSMSEINKIIGQQWKSLNEEERQQYKEMGQADFQQKTEKWNRALELTQSNQSAHSDINYTQFAFTRMHCTENIELSQ